jgi:hypothetical protein
MERPLAWNTILSLSTLTSADARGEEKTNKTATAKASKKAR